MDSGVCFLLSLSFSDFLIYFAPLVKGSFCILPVYLGAPYAFIKLTFTYQKKKKTIKLIYMINSLTRQYP
jgi:hypothetical protein